MIILVKCASYLCLCHQSNNTNRRPDSIAVYGYYRAHAATRKWQAARQYSDSQSREEMIEAAHMPPPQARARSREVRLPCPTAVLVYSEIASSTTITC